VGYVDDTLAGNERVLFRARLHWIIYRNALLFLIPGILLVAGSYNSGIDPKTATAFEGWGLLIVLAALVAFAQEFIERWTTEIAVTSRRFAVKRGLIRRSIMEINAGQIESVRIDQSAFGRLLGYGTIIVAGTGSGIDPVHRVATPLPLREAVNGISRGNGMGRGGPLRRGPAAPGYAPDVCGALVGDGAFAFPVVGLSHHQAVLERIAGGRSQNGVKKFCAALLIPEPDNPYDSDAVAVYIGREQAGYLSRGVAPEFLEALEHAGFGRAACEAVVVGGWDHGPRDRGDFSVRLNACRPFRLQSGEEWAKRRRDGVSRSAARA
jgi:hypothetical protein